jgi:polyisoprenoid-binding protein YceI
VVPWPHIPGLHDLAPASRKAWHEASEFGHEWLVYLTLALLFLHLGAVAKHQLVGRDEVFARMAPGARPGWTEPRQWLVVVAMLAIVAFGYSYMPSPKIAQPPAADAPAPPGAKIAEAAPPAAAPVAWVVQPGSSLGFVASWLGQPIEGRFGRWEADIVFSPDALADSHIRATVDLASVSTGDAQRDASLTGPDWFDTATHPKAIFTGASFTKTGEGRYTAKGTLDLRGARKPVNLAFSLTVKGDTATAKGDATLDRTLFGVGQGEWATTDRIAATVQIRFALTAKRK